MGFINIKDTDGNEHTIHTSQLPAVNQKMTVSFSCPSCSELKQLLIEALPIVERGNLSLHPTIWDLQQRIKQAVRE